MLWSLALGPRAAAAQLDTLGRDTTARDTTATDTAEAILPIFPRALVPGPQPAGTRYVFEADSLILSNIYTLSDLLGHVPGVYLARAGFVGQPEYVLYAGRGAAGLELYWDGVPHLPLGRDSAYLDPARVPLAVLERVEVLPLPGVLRVYLVSRRQASTHAGSAVGIVTGDRNIARYRGLFARRWRSGTGISIVGEWNDIDGVPGTSSPGAKDVDVWVNLEYTPTRRFGVSYQLLAQTLKREASDALVDPWEERRRDGVARLFFAPRGAGPGPRFTLTVGSTGMSGDSAVADRKRTHGTLEATLAGPRAHAGVALRAGDRRQPLEVEARASWAPLRQLVLSAEGRRLRYHDARAGRRARLAAGLQLVAGLSLRGEAVWAEELESPLFLSDPLEETFDVAWAARWERRWITVEVGGGRRAGYGPTPVPSGLKVIQALSATPRSDYVRVLGALRPVPWLSLAGWYFDPLQGGGDFEPPTHARVSATFFSRFLRTFPSGTFALRGEVAVESWSTWVGGISGGTQNQLGGATFVDLHIGMQIGDVHAFWTMRDSNAMGLGYVPGLDFPAQRQYYGVRWQFRN